MIYYGVFDLLRSTYRAFHATTVIIFVTIGNLGDNRGSTTQAYFLSDYDDVRLQSDFN